MGIENYTKIKNMKVKALAIGASYVKALFLEVYYPKFTRIKF